ncbi:hypothetical protein DPX16_20857 [Anabarilius grahami]|uniref:Uncharacterized protein n=1 Tax=Anabarilius grahami TaxID=495550 RepID=A0A3N0XTK0_ANAGA|nr:hypothetical protein DPX16_20857 [Anabarilius grahami]
MKLRGKEAWGRKEDSRAGMKLGRKIEKFERKVRRFGRKLKRKDARAHGQQNLQQLHEDIPLLDYQLREDLCIPAMTTLASRTLLSRPKTGKRINDALKYNLLH